MKIKEKIEKYSCSYIVFHKMIITTTLILSFLSFFFYFLIYFKCLYFTSCRDFFKQVDSNVLSSEQILIFWKNLDYFEQSGIGYFGPFLLNYIKFILLYFLFIESILNILNLIFGFWYNIKVSYYFLFSYFIIKVF